MTRVQVFLALVLTLCVSTARAETPVPDGVLGLTPVGEQSCFVVEIPLRPTEKLTALRWFQNDELAPFPQLSLVDASNPKELAAQRPLVSWTDVGGRSQAWTEVQLKEPLGSSSGQLLAVFQLPPNREKLGEGRNGGPALGYWEEKGGLAAWFGELGGDWYPLASNLKLAVEAQIVTSLASATTGGATSMKTSEEDSSATDKVEEVYETSLLAPSPNPSNPSTEIHFSLHRSGSVRLSIYNQRGEKVWDLDPQNYTAGPHVVKWTGQDGTGTQVASGVYFVRMQADGKDLKQRITVVR